MWNWFISVQPTNAGLLENDWLMAVQKNSGKGSVGGSVVAPN